MIDENRFQRLEDKVDNVKEEVTEVRFEVSEIRNDMKGHMDFIEDHVAGDKKIIDELQPVLAKLPTIVEMAEQYQFQKKLRKKTYKAIGIAATLSGIIFGIIRYL